MRSPRWDGDHPITQLWGPTDVEEEPYDPRAPGFTHFHQGIDIGWSDENDQEFAIYSRENAQVITSYIAPTESALVLRADGKDFWHFHCSEHLVEAGDRVTAGQLVARAGSIGLAEGVHLHFEVRPGGSRYYPYNSVDPMPFLAFLPGPPPIPKEDVMPAEVPFPPIILPAGTSGPYDLAEMINTSLIRCHVRLRSTTVMAASAHVIAVDHATGAPVADITLSVAGGGKSADWMLPDDLDCNIVVQTAFGPGAISYKVETK